MIKTIQNVLPVLVNGKHYSYQSKKSQKYIFVFAVTFDDGTQGQFGQAEQLCKYAIGDKVNATILSEQPGKPIYWKLEKENTIFSPKETPLRVDNTSVAIAATNKAIDLISKAKGAISFKDPESLKNIDALSTKIANLMINLARKLDL